MFRKPLVEDTIAICPHSLIKEGRLVGTVAGVDYEIDLQLKNLCLQYLLPNGQLQSGELPLDATRPNYGGLRWWAVCHFCDERCRTLYLPANRSIFGCRGCFGLSYETQRLGQVRRAALACQKLKTRYPAKRPQGMWRRTHLHGIMVRTSAEDKLWQLAGLDALDASSRGGLLAEIESEGGWLQLWS